MTLEIEDQIRKLVQEAARGESAMQALVALCSGKILPAQSVEVPPQEPSAPSPPPKVRKPDSKVRAGAWRRSNRTILQIRDDLMKIFQAHGPGPVHVRSLYAELPGVVRSTLCTVVSDLTREGLIDRVGLGRYSLPA